MTRLFKVSSMVDSVSEDLVSRDLPNSIQLV
jgi:hypothetical protein